MRSHSISVVTAVNDRYLGPATVMLYSLMSSLAPGYRVEAWIMTTRLAAESRHAITHALRMFPIEIEFLEVADLRLTGLKIDGHVSVETYLRLLAAERLGFLDKVLYLDADLLVRQSTHPLFEVDATKAHLLAVPHVSPASAFFGGSRGVPSFSLLGIPPETRTFNAGVMVMNLKRWRETSTTDRIFKYLRTHGDRVLWWDQDGLNAVLYQSWAPLPTRWNYMTSHWQDFTSWQDSLLDEATFASTRADPAIIHYSAGAKPWTLDYAGPFGDDWWRVYSKVAARSIPATAPIVYEA